MTSTPQDSQAERSQLPNSNPTNRNLANSSPGFPKTVLPPLVKRLRFQFLSSRLFIPVLSVSLLGIAGTAFLLSEVIKYQAEEEIQSRLESKVDLIDATLVQASTFAQALRTSFSTLHLREAKTPETYRQLTLELFKARPPSVTGLGFGQSQNGLLPDRAWLFSHYFLNTNDPNAVGQALPAPDEEIRYVDGTQPGNFYPESDRYRNFFLPQTNLWTPPYRSANGLQTSYYAPIFDDRDRWLGTVFVDVDQKLLNESLAGSVFNQRGFYALLTPEGQVVTAPRLPADARGSDYRSIAGLDAVWDQMAEGQSGLIEGEKGYWAYARVPQNRWLAVSFVPYAAVFNQLFWISVGGAVLTAGVLLLLLLAAMRSLDRRLRPLLNECERLEVSAGTTSTASDELAQISEAFFKLLEQVRSTEAQSHQTAAQIHELEAQQRQVAIVELEQKTLHAEVEHLAKVVDSVEQGDLLVAAQVGSQKTSLIADTLNRLIRRLGEALGSVVNHAGKVKQSTRQVEQIAALVTDAAQQQIQEANRVQTLLDTISTTAQNAVAQAIAATEAISETHHAIRAGQPEISAMGEKVNTLRQGTEQLVKRTQTLTSYVESTTQFAKDQKRIAAMTRVLAANASMLASRASGQQDPEQFAVITRELETIAAQVNQLAAQTNQSLIVLQQRTDQIQTVVSGLDYDIQTMGQQIQQFDSGIDRTQQMVEQVQSISDSVTQLGQQSTSSHQAIAAAAQTIVDSIRQIAAIATTTLDRADLTQVQVQQIEQQVQALLNQVQFFKLQPAQRQPELPRLVGTAAKSEI